MTRRHVGTAIAESLAAHGTSRAFLVPGESFLPVLDGLYNSPVEAIVSRQEGGASYMAEAYGKATGEPGVAMVTRGPGASNAFVGVHTGWQDGTPMVIFVGLIPFSDRDRESFQEFDPKAWFGTQAKQVFVLDDPTRASRVVAEAFFQAKQGRPGPVIVGLPEDVLYQDFEGEIEAPIPVTEGAVSAADAAYVSEKLAAAKKPLIFAGGGRWTPESARAIEKFAEINQVPVVHDFRASDRISFSSPANAGWLGYGRNDRAAELLSEADVLLEVGALLTDVPSDGYILRQDPHAENIVVNIDTGLRGHSGAISRHILASPVALAEALDNINTGEISSAQSEWFKNARRAHQEFSTIPSESDWRATSAGTAHMEAVIKALQDQLPEEAIFTFGAGNHCIWAQQFLPTQHYPSQLAARNGSMGYSVPGAVSAKLQFPERPVVAIAGDGEYLMNGQELATAVQFGAPFLTVIMTNGEFGTIRDHQKNHFPDRVSGTQLANPDFAAVAKGYGAHGESVDADADVAGAIERALKAVNNGIPAVVNVYTDQDLSLPATR
ncbi:thiamine pyrophosphate-binding protein [Corynebacterium accolens]|jgi:acetolactate synthase large subunit|uniref:thiamine pyrophosphate-dependent enzyme n=1 Tax=Corynebacterium accolens TaxID=38284 RepID=UPI001EDA4209|nr:thiamine pyrophosphate-dependent enzyme [Corynebacterium accolens]MDK4209438.1 thiamine pyrophosphate-binding protein [Corynebacterium accolens]MDK4233678.1 thiamine pyrophosphate-binding protein [Corynebacterium accolens]WKS65909.1 thiamine pyrophosphate-binding protein [Corynebacterium accolens]